MLPTLNDDVLQHIAEAVDAWDHTTLDRSARACCCWRDAFAPRLAALRARLSSVGLDGPIFSLSLRLQRAIIDAESDELLRRPTLWKERRRALLSSLDEIDLRELHSLSRPPAGVAEALNAAITLAPDIPWACGWVMRNSSGTFMLPE